MKDEILYILDRSGSMDNIIDDAIGGFNSNLREQKEVGPANVTIVLFDDQYEVVCDRLDINEVKEMTRQTYSPRGATALLDAVGRAVSSLSGKIDSGCPSCKPTKVSVVIITDGYENSSIEFTKSKIKEMIEHQQKEHDWQVLFLAANMDAVAEGSSFGVQAQNAVNFAATGRGVQKVYCRSSSMIRNYRSQS